MLVCHCHRVSEATVGQVAATARDLRSVVRATRAGTGCGGCLPSLRALCQRALDGADECATVGVLAG